MTSDLLLEIGVEELPASFVENAVEALPGLLTSKLEQLRLTHGDVRAGGTPRRLWVLAPDVADAQPDLDEEVMGPPARVAFDGEGRPTRAAQSFADKIGLPVSELGRRETPKGEYLVGRRRERGAPAPDLLPAVLGDVIKGIPFRKSMRWSDGEQSFGRPVRWLLALFGEQALKLSFAGVESGATTRGHRFLAPEPLVVKRPGSYLDALREHHVVADIEERKRVMEERLRAAAEQSDGALIPDDFLLGENCSLVEDPAVLVGSFEAEFLSLPERVILDVAKGHQRYFGMRDSNGRLMPRYLCVVNTAENPENVIRGNDRVMRARLADAKFFYDEDLKRPLADRRAALDGVMFHKRLGSVGDKVRRVERLVGVLGAQLGLSAASINSAEQGARLAKCDLVTLMVGELPELQGEMGQAYARAQGVDEEVAQVISEHYRPRGADDPTASSDAGALVAVADRIDTLVGCFGLGLAPSGTADPLALRRAAIGFLRTLLDKQWELSNSDAIRAAFEGFGSVKLDLALDKTQATLGGFLQQRLRGVLGDGLPADVVDACLAASADRAHDVALRARALATLSAERRASAGEVFKRATNITKDAPDGEPVSPAEIESEVHPSEQQLFDELARVKAELADATKARDYPRAFARVGEFAPFMQRYFNDVMVMVEDDKLRNNRLRLMRTIRSTCSSLALFNLLAPA